MRPFRIGLVGAGRMGRTHLRALAGSGPVAVTAIAEMSAAARSALSVPDATLHEFDQLRWLTGQDIDGLAAVASGFISLGRYYPVGDAVWAEAFGTRGHERCDVIDPAEGEVAQLEALRRQAESFAGFAGGAPCEGATAADAIAALGQRQRGDREHPVTCGAGPYTMA